MPAKTSNQKFDGVAITLHWIIGLLVLFMLWFGHYIGDIPREDPGRGAAYNLHESIGIVILLLMLVRLWWRIKHPAPPLPDMKKWERVFLKATHDLFYALLILMPLAGWAMYSAVSKSPFELFQAIPWFKLGFVTSFGDSHEVHEFFESIHVALGWVILTLFGLHILGVANHTLIKKDGVIKRILPWG